MLPLTRALNIALKARIIYSVGLSGIVGMIMARRDLPRLEEFLWGIIVLSASSSGSALMNNLLDRDIDPLMARTAGRENALQRLGIRRAWWLASFLVGGSLLLSHLIFTWQVTLLVALAVVSYVWWYTLILKRTDPYGTILGGIPGALPIPIGAYMMSQRYMPDVWLAFTFMMLWQPAHFWALALKRQDDYRGAEVPVLPVAYGNTYTKLFIYLYGFTLLPVSLAMGFLGGYGVIYSVLASLAGLYYLYETVVMIHYREQFMRGFFASLVYLIVWFIAIIADVLV